MTQQVRRALGRFPVLAGVILLAGVNGALASSAATDPTTSPTPPLQGAAPARLALVNTCVFPDPAGERPVTMDVQATLPKVVPTGKPLQVKDFSLTFTIGEGALTGLTEVAGAVTLELMVTQEDKKTPVPVALEIPSTKVPAAGELKLVATGKVPDIVVSLPGELRLTTGAPSLTLTGVPADPPLKPVTCEQAPDQDSELGRVTLLKLNVVKPQPGKSGQKPGPGAHATNEEPEREPIAVIPLQPFETQGTSTVAKLGALVRLTPSFIFNAFYYLYPEPPHRTTGSTMMPASEVKFLGFGFVPINGTMELLPTDYQTGNTVIDVETMLHGDTTTTAVLRLELFGKLKNVTINGVTLDVGDHCMTSEPIVLNLRGPNWDPFNGGVLRTDPNDPEPAFRGFTLPAFSGCGVKEDLDSLLSGMGSGPGNQACVGVNQVGLPWDDVRKCPNAEPPVARR